MKSYRFVQNIICGVTAFLMFANLTIGPKRVDAAPVMPNARLVATAALLPTAIPTPRPPTATDFASFAGLIDALYPRQPAAVGNIFTITNVTIVHQYAVVYWDQIHRVGEGAVGGDLLAEKTLHGWETLNHDHGIYAIGDLLYVVPQMGVATATALAQIGQNSAIPYHCGANGVCTPSNPRSTPPR